MFYFICTAIQFFFWWTTFFKAKRMVWTPYEIEGRYGARTEHKFIETDERYKFPLGLVLIGWLFCFLPIIGLIAYIAFNYGISNMRDSEFDNERPSFALVRWFNKKV